jgi:GNAT superfamily N-acetyltransferase
MDMSSSVIRISGQGRDRNTDSNAIIRSAAGKGDFGYAIDAHNRAYTTEFSYDDSFIAFITDAITAYEGTYNSDREHLWILESGEQPIGCVAIVEFDERTAQLRWFLLEKEARGFGYGKRMLYEAVRFCREKGYSSIFLWTNDSLTTARALYETHGFTVIRRRIRMLSNQQLNEEKWELVLKR